MKKYVKMHWFEAVVAFLLTLVACIGISAVFGYCFRSNDDAMLRNIVSGNYTGIPDAHLIYVMYPLGLLWKGLYTAFPAIAWYDLFMVGMHYLCWYMILFRLGQQFVTKRGKSLSVILGLGALVIIDLPYVVMHQYTILSALLAVVAIFWLATSKNKSGKEYWFDRVICIIFLTLCLWLRKQVFFMALPIGFFILVLEFLAVNKEQIKVTIRSVAVFLGCVLLIGAISFAVEKIAYSSPEWQDFEVYNQARTDIYDFYGVPSYQGYEEQYEQLDISYGDWLVIDHYDGGLMPELDSEMLLSVAALSKQNFDAIRETYSVLLQTLYSVCQVVLYNDIQPIGILLTVLYAVSLWICYKKDKKGTAACICGMLIFQAVFVGYFIGQQRFPEHVSYGLYLMQFFFLAAVLLTTKAPEKEKMSKRRFWTCLLLLLCIGLMGGLGIYRMRTTLTDYQQMVVKADDWNYVNEYFEEHNNATYCIVTKSFVFSTEKMFETSSVENSNVVRLGSWVQNSPLEGMHNQNAGVKKLSEQIISEDDFYIVQLAENDTEWISTFMRDSGFGEGSVEVADVLQTPGGMVFHVLSVQ